ncbi:MAG: AAA family ATPase [Kiritimatiellia bacterium]
MNEKLPDNLKKIALAYQSIKSEIANVIVGQEEVIDQVLIAILSRGHCLLLGVPGLAKTLLVHSLGEILDLDFNRVQFTPDLMPSDITGTEILDEEQGSSHRSLRFVKGPVFTNLLLADEINRTPPKTQAALLEAMQENVVTTSGRSFRLPQPFFVLATQNPIEQEGTYPLPEAQLDRFMFLVRMNYPGRDEEIQVLRQTTVNRVVELKKLLSGSEIIELQHCVRDIPVSEHVLAYCIDLVRMTRPESQDSPVFIKENLSFGAGPRAGQYLVLAAKARAALAGRINVSCADVRYNAQAVLSHRIACNFHAAGEGIDATQIVNKLIDYVPEPDSSGV